MRAHRWRPAGVRHTGTTAQHLRPIITAERVWCRLFSESDAGSDLASLSCSAVRDGDRYVVNGQKVWCSNGRAADWGILMARTEPGARHKGISFLLMDMATPGVQTRPLRQMNGEATFDEVFLDEARIPAANLLGPGERGLGRRHVGADRRTGLHRGIGIS
ncbi:MAG: acyl-CoA dehydrogenase family protein [Microthrixaceae bacterium]|nr:acyl-CoA dehydrogenase family protein [Microthrixaceae bacterium]